MAFYIMNTHGFTVEISYNFPRVCAKTKIMIHKIHHLKCGSMCPVCAPLFGQKGWKAEIVCHCLLVETDRGLVLIDTGFGLQDYLHMQQRLGSLVKRLGKLNRILSSVLSNKFRNWVFILKMCSTFL